MGRVFGHGEDGGGWETGWREGRMGGGSGSGGGRDVGRGCCQILSPLLCLIVLHTSLWSCTSNCAGTHPSRPMGAAGRCRCSLAPRRCPAASCLFSAATLRGWRAALDWSLNLLTNICHLSEHSVPVCFLQEQCGSKYILKALLDSKPSFRPIQSHFQYMIRVILLVPLE